MRSWVVVWYGSSWFDLDINKVATCNKKNYKYSELNSISLAPHSLFHSSQRIGLTLSQK